MVGSRADVGLDTSNHKLSPGPAHAKLKRMDVRKGCRPTATSQDMFSWSAMNSTRPFGELSCRGCPACSQMPGSQCLLLFRVPFLSISLDVSDFLNHGLVQVGGPIASRLFGFLDISQHLSSVSAPTFSILWTSCCGCYDSLQSLHRHRRELISSSRAQETTWGIWCVDI